MPFMGSDLAILNAEQYDVGIRFPSMRTTRRSVPTTMDADNDAGPRKKAKTQQASESEKGEEEKKRTRGRPRLDTKDETAADRRRTQIRLAQRAYRNRKENAIVTLEKRVQELKDMNEEMSNAFMKLHDSAVSHGLLDTAPEFGRQLRAATETFLALARRSSEEDAAAGSGGDSERQGVAESSGSGRRQQGPRDKSSSPEAIDRNPLSYRPGGGNQLNETHLYGGIILSREPEPSAAADREYIDRSLAAFADPPLEAMVPKDMDYEIITQPTFDNASFPFTMPDSPFGSFLDTALDNSPPPPLPPSSSGYPPPSSLPPTTTTIPPALSATSYSAMEVTFGRRLQRRVLERAYELLNAPGADPTRFARVFGFCMVFEPVERIRQRVRAGLDKMPYETLDYWQYPFVHLGGAGTQYPPSVSATSVSGATTITTTTTNTSATSPPTLGSIADKDYASSSSSSNYRQNHHAAVISSSTRPVGNQGMADPLRPRFGTGFSTGPFDEATTVEGRARLDSRLRILMPGFEGAFFDCDETELYLRERGVDIPPGTDRVVAEVDVEAFRNEEEEDGGGGGSAVGVSNDRNASGGGGGGGNAMYRGRGRSSSTDFASVVGLPGLESHSNSNNNNNSAGTGGGGSRSHGHPSSTSPSSSSSALQWGNPLGYETYPTSAPHGFGDGNSLLSYGGGSHGQRGMSSGRKLVTLDVNTLVRELVDRATCLGRSPGFRVSDVNEAFWSTVRSTATA